MNEKAEKAIAGLIQQIANHISNVRDSLGSTNSALDKVAQRETMKPSAELKEKKAEPQDITSALEQLCEFCITVENEAGALSGRANSLF